jgi:hypothetical protein
VAHSSGGVESGDEPGTPVHSPTISDDEGNVGDRTGEGAGHIFVSPGRWPRSITP